MSVLLALVALLWGIAAAFGLVRWWRRGVFPNAGADAMAGPRGLQLFVVGAVLCALCLRQLLQ